MNIRRITILLILALYAISNVNAQEKPPWPIDSSKSEKYKKEILSRNPQERINAAMYLMFLSADEIGPDLMNDIVNLLFKEEERMNKVRKEMGYSDGTVFGEDPKSGESGASYIGYLCTIVGKSGNLKALPLLMKYSTHGKYLVGYGEEAVKYFFEGIERWSSMPHRLGYLLNILGYWLADKKEGYIARGATREQIKAELIKRALSDKEYIVKSIAVKVLTKATDGDLIPVFEKIAANDPWHFEEGLERPTDKKPAPGKKVLRYPLRELAKGEIEKRSKK